MKKTNHNYQTSIDWLISNKLSKVTLFNEQYVTGDFLEFVRRLLAFTFKSQRIHTGFGNSTVKKQPQLTILPTSMNDVVGMYRNQKLLTAVRQFTVRITDGVPLVWLAWLKGFRPVGRLYGPDIMRAIIAEGRRYRLRHYFYGGTKKTLKQLTQRLAERYPGCRVAGMYAPPFRDLSAQELLFVQADIARAKPDILWIGIGSWRQVLFAQELSKKVAVPLIIPVGAAFDFLAGVKHQAPRFMMLLGMEWFFRLCSEPGRLWKRYILQIPLFVAFAVADIVRHHRKVHSS